jgi:hypothetical protein
MEAAARCATFHLASAAQRNPTQAGCGNVVVSRAVDRIQTAPSAYEPPRVTWKPLAPLFGLGSVTGAAG